MMKSRRSRRAVVAAALIGLVAVPVAGSAGLTMNWTPSAAQGLYWRADRAPAKGELVLVCPPDRQVFQVGRERGYIRSGSCPGGFEPLVKRYLAAKGDRVSIDANGVRVNGLLLPNSAPMASDSKGRPMPRMHMDRVLGAGEVLLITDYVRSFDGRYTGPLPASVIVGPLDPVATL